MTASKWPAVVNALISVFDAATTVDVYDGIPVTYAELPTGLAVGVDAAYDNGTSGSFRQDWRDAGPAPAAHREETGEVACSVWAQDGGDDLSALRTRVFDVLTAVTDSMHYVSTLGIAEVMSVRLVQADPIQRRTKNGAIVEVAFRVEYYAVFN